MIPFRVFSVLALSMLALSACASAHPVNVQQELNTWIGHDADGLVRAWGPPDRTYDFKDGSRVMEYERNRVDTYGGWNRPHGGMTVGSDSSAIGVGFPLWDDEPTISIRRCTMKFETNGKRIIRTASFTGPNCAYALRNSIAKNSS